MIFIRFRRSLLSRLGATSEEGCLWLMDYAELSVYADYNYLLVKARWALKQMEASAITVDSNSVEGVLGFPGCFLQGKSVPLYKRKLYHF
jgi:hypothetical protein